MAQVLRLRNVYFTYPGGQAASLDDISLDIAAGEWVCVVGAVGSGKSTLGRLCAGLLTADRGEVWRAGPGPAGWLAQDPVDSLVAATVEEDVGFGPGNLGVAGDSLRQLVMESLAEVGLGSEVLQRDPLLLSGGERQRVALAGVLAMRRSLLVLDEPAGMLDGRSQRLVLRAVRRAATDCGAGVLHITHSLSEALLSQRLVVLRRGRVMATGRPEVVLREPEVLQALGASQPPLLQLADELERRGRRVVPEEWSVEGMRRALREAAGLIPTGSEESRCCM